MIVRRAVLRLALQHSAILFGVFALFAVGVSVYAAAAFDIDLPDASDHAVAQANTTLRTALIACYVALVVIVPPASYLMARRSLDPVRANLEAQQRFIDDASHEFRTPIAVAQGELELALLRPRSPEEYRAAMAVALSALEDLGSLTTDLLLLARNETPDDADIADGADLASRAVGAVEPALRTRITVAAGAGAAVRGSSELLVRAIVNLLENAGKHTPPGSPIELVVEDSAERVRFSVTDHGPGMSPEQVHRAFDRFWRGDAARSTPGRGIGLSIVRRIAELHRGGAELRSVQGQGTTAVVEIPRADREG